MMTSITLAEAQAKLPEIIRQLATGENVAILEGDQVVARIVADRRPLGQRPGPGLGRGLMTIVAEVTTTWTHSRSTCREGVARFSRCALVLPG